MVTKLDETRRAEQMFEGLCAIALAIVIVAFFAAASCGPTDLAAPRLEAGSRDRSEADVSGFETLDAAPTPSARKALPASAPRGAGSDQSGPPASAARERGESALRVLDEDSRLELSEVEVALAPPSGFRSLHHPGQDATVVRRGAASPVDVAAHLNRGHLFVRTPRHAWHRVRAGSLEGDGQVVYLEPGGHLSARFAGSRGRDGLVLRVRRRGRCYGRPLAEAPIDGTGSVRIESLPLGKYLAQVEAGPWRDDPPIRAAEELEIRSGEWTELHFDEVSEVPEGLVEMGGELYVPPAWDVDRFLMRVELLDPPRRARRKTAALLSARMEPQGDPSVLSWRTGSVQPGRYAVRIERLEFETIVTVDAHSGSSLLIDVPPPVTVAVHVVDRVTLARVEMPLLSWRGDTGGDGVARRSIVRRSSVEPFELRVPRGRIRLESAVPGYHFENLVLDATASVTECTLQVDLTCGVHLKLWHGDRPLWWTDEWRRGVRMELDGESSTSTGVDPRIASPALLVAPSGVLRTSDVAIFARRSVVAPPAAAVTFEVRRPGRYRLTLPQVPGFKPVGPLTFELDRGEFREEHVRLYTES